MAYRQGQILLLDKSFTPFKWFHLRLAAGPRTPPSRVSPAAVPGSAQPKLCRGSSRQPQHLTKACFELRMCLYSILTYILHTAPSETLQPTPYTLHPRTNDVLTFHGGAGS